jgi:hypothetical protein
MLDDKDEFETFDAIGRIAGDLGITRERMVLIRDETKVEMQKAIEAAKSEPWEKQAVMIDKAFNNLMLSRYGLVRRSYPADPYPT